jgi:hypothetical protein
MRMFGVAFDATTAWPWLVAVALIAIGAFLTRLVWPMVVRAWNEGLAAAPHGGPA